MKIIGKLLTAGVFVFFLIAGSAGADIKPPAEGGVLPAIDLAIPQNAEHQEYLGIVGSKTFTIPEIKAEVVLIEIFSMY